MLPYDLLHVKMVETGWHVWFSAVECSQRQQQRQVWWR